MASPNTSKGPLQRRPACALLAVFLLTGAASAQPTAPEVAPVPASGSDGSTGGEGGSAYGQATGAPGVVSSPAADPDVKILAINLPTALQIANAANPTIAVAQARVRQAFARFREAEVTWVPNLSTGPAYNRHDGLIQNSLGLVFPTNKWNLFIGGQAAASVDVSDALFGQLIARRLVDAQAAAARTTTSDIQLDVALAYLDLQQAYAALAINRETLAAAREMLRDAEAALRAGVGKTTADVNRARTEVNLREQEEVNLQGQGVAVPSARLAQLLLLEPTVELRPTDPAVLPIMLVPEETNLDELVGTGLMNRPELAESRSLVAAALERWRQTRVGPFLPRVDASYSSGYFGGGINDNTQRFGGRGDGTAQATWELHNFGFGDAARMQLTRAQYDEANFHQVEVQARVAAEVTSAAKLARARRRTLEAAQGAVRQAELMWKKLEALTFGVGMPAKQFDPLEALLAEQALNQARVTYLNEVIEYNRAQFRLYWAMGQPPLCALPQATALPVEVPVEPSPRSAAPAPLLPGPSPVEPGKK